MKNIIVTMAIGNNPAFIYGIESMERYAARIGADFHVIRECKVNYRAIYFEKMQALEFFDHGYDRVLFLDADILVSPNARNIFEVYPNMDTFYAFDENTFPGNMDMDREPMLKAIPRDFLWRLNSCDKWQYFNVGVMLFGKESSEFMKFSHTVPDVPEMWIFPEQTAFNYLVQKLGVKFESIERSFNRFDAGIPDPNGERFKADFIHYAGPCKYGDPGRRKDENMRDDWRKLVRCS